MQNTEVLKHFANLIKEELGIVYAEHNYFQLQNRLEEVAKAFFSGSVNDLYKASQPRLSGHVRTMLMDLATNNETLFFRDQKIFTALETHILPRFVSQVSNREFRVWSAACSSGQEPLSVAITIEEWCERAKRPLNYKITASDISERILEKAKTATYTALEASRGLNPSIMTKYFTTTENKVRARESILQKIDFKKANLRDPMSLGQDFDLILCRNVLIYQPVESKKEILSRLAQKLSPQGYLILGAGESLIGLSEDFNLIQCEGAVIYERKSAFKVSA